MANVVARIKLAPGQTGYYDDKSGIVLSWSHPYADVLEGMDVSDLRRSVKYHRISVVAGSLGRAKTFKQILMEAKSKRTGIPLEELMGDTPLGEEPTTPIDAASEEPSKPTTTIDVKPEESTAKESAAPSSDTKEKAEDTKTDETKSETTTKTAETTEESSAADTKAETTTETKTDTSADSAKEEPTEDPLTTTPKSFRSLKVGGTKDIVANKTVTKVSVSDEKVATAVFDGTTVTVEGIKAGNVDVTIEAGKESVVVSGVVVDA